MSKKSFIAEIELTGYEYPNKATGICEGGKVVVKNGIPGQRVSVNIKKKRGKLEGSVISVIRRADYEIESPCEEFGICGGCNFQCMPYEKELELKSNCVLKLMSEGGIKDFEFLGIEPCPETEGYRNKMELSFGDSGRDGELTLGMRKRGSFYEVANAADCRLIDSDMSKMTLSTLNFFKDSGEAFYHKTRHTGALRHLILRKGYFSGEILINLVTTDKINTNLQKYADEIRSLDLSGNITGILHTICNSVADAVKPEATEILYGRDYFNEKLLGLNFTISPFSFFQTNSAGAERLYSTVRDFAEPLKKDSVFDLYCGTGTIAQVISPYCREVIGVEIVNEAVDAAKKNAKENGITNCRFIVGDVLKEIENIKAKPDLIILDPPREGINPKAIGKIAAFGAENIIYISCKASSMSKDINFFLENGYSIIKLKCIDLFARTPHVECVVLMSRVDK